jgi:hypothetical protein
MIRLNNRYAICGESDFGTLLSFGQGFQIANYLSPAEQNLDTTGESGQEAASRSAAQTRVP